MYADSMYADSFPAGWLRPPHAGGSQRANSPAAVAHKRSANDTAFRDPESCAINPHPPAIPGFKPRSKPYAEPDPYIGRYGLYSPGRASPGGFAQDHLRPLPPASRQVTMSAARASIFSTTATGRAPPSSASASSPSCRVGWPRRCPIHTPSGIWSLSKPRTRSFRRAAPADADQPRKIVIRPLRPPASGAAGCARRSGHRLRADRRCRRPGNSVEPHLHFETRLGPPALPSQACVSTRRMPRRQSGIITRCGAPRHLPHIRPDGIARS